MRPFLKAYGIVDPGARRSALRLMLATVLSAFLHGAVLYGVAVRPPETGETYVIHARLGGAAALAEAATAQGPETSRVARESPDSTPRQSDPAGPALPAPGIEPNYYPARQLDVVPKALDPVDPVIPEQAIRNRVNGSVLLALRIDEAGIVREASVIEAEPAGYFEESALSAFRKTRFSPGMKNGRPVRSRMLVRVNYDSGVESSVRRP